ncbi:MAG: hypothetical protein AAFW70_28915, partial [Cyanobacteria bacterium J06635_10]
EFSVGNCKKGSVNSDEASATGCELGKHPYIKVRQKTHRNTDTNGIGRFFKRLNIINFHSSLVL